MENLYENFKKYANKAYNQVAPLIPFSNANQYNFNPNSNLYQNTKELNIQNDTDILNQQMANYRANQNGTFMLNALTKSDEQKQKDSIDFDNKFIDLATAKGYTPHKAIDKDGKARYAIEKDGVFKEIEPSFLNELKANSYEMLGSLAGVATALPHPLAKTAGVAGKILTPMVGSAVGSGAGAMADTYLNNKSVGENTTAEQLANSFTGGANNDILGAGLATALTSKPAINTLKGTLKVPLEVLDKGLAGVGARHILSQNIGGAETALKANLGGEYEVRNALDSAKDALGADLDNFVSKDLKTINKTSDNRYIQKGIDIANSAINKANETLKGLNIGKADAELLLSALGHENGVKNILDAVANNPQSAQKIAKISSNLNKSFSDSINEQLAKFETQTPKDSFKNSFNQVKQDYADTKDILIKNSNYQSDFKDLNDNLATILSDTQNINTRGVFNALNGGGNLENLLNAKNAINEQLSYIMRADFKSSSDFINQKALSEAKNLIDNEINTALKNDENLINLYKSANGDYATMKNIVDSNLMSQISRDGKTSLEALNAMIKSNDNINGVTLNDFLSSLGAKDRAIAEANIIKGLMEKNSVNGVVDFRALNQSLNSLDFGSEFAKELRSQILNRQALLNNTSDILNALGNKVVKSKSMSQGISTDPLKRAETMKANLIIEKIKPLIPKLGNNEALKLHLNRAILNANGDFKLAIKNIDNIPDGNLPTPTRNLLNEFKEAVKEIEKQVVKADNQPNLSNQANNANIDSLTKQISYLQNALQNQSKDAPTPSPIKQEADSLSEATPNLTQNSIKGDGFVTYPQTATQKYPYNAFLDIEKDLATELNLPQAQIRASLQYLWDNHAKDGMFKNKRDVYNTIKMLIGYQDYAGNSFKNPNMAYIATKTSDNKMSDMVISRDSGGVVHLNKDKKMSQTDKKNLNNEPMAETPKSQRKQQVLGVRMNTSKEHFSSANAQTIPNQTIKQAETIAKDLTADAPSELYKAHRKAQKAKEAPKPQEPKATTAKPTTQEPQAKSEPMATQTTKTKETTQEPTQDTFDILKIDKNISDEQVETLLKEIEDKNLKVNLPLRDEEPLGKALQKDELGYSRKSLLTRALNEQFLKRHKGFIERAKKTQSKAEFQKFLKENKAEVVEYIKDMVINTLRYIDAYGEGYHFTNKSSLRRANDMILSLESGKNFYFYNKAPNKITNPAPKSNYADKLVDGNEAIQGTYKLSDEIKQDLIKSLREFVSTRQNLADNIADMKSRWWHKIKEQERLAPSVLEGDKKANNGYDENLLEALKHEHYLLNQFEKIVKSPQKTSSDLELAKNYYSFLQGDTYTKNALNEISQARQLLEQELNIRPIKEFGTNYAEFYHDGANAIKKLLTQRQGQVAGAFNRQELGDIDLVWGEVTDAIKHKGYGLSHILDKRIAEFMEQGLSKEQAGAKAIELINKLPDIIKNGEIEQNGGRFRIEKDNYVIGLTSEYKGEKRNWIITAFEKGNPQSFTEADFIAKSDNLLANPNKNSTPKEIKSQDQKVEQKAGQYAKWLSQADKIAPQAPDELYKAYDKAKRT
ncbi:MULTISPECIES: hypothetical protein [Campylobacter]|uniref:Phage-Barnase-EndoU-ColicinE5/D-RelE-like nuclease domain-containing protein n=1 Tax=Campylobacter vicugnae TaxID=1660076 RepID=A0ABZ2E7F1_9BACT|nr:MULTISPECIES: hypothetical protein [unclassified Campylobacter]MCR8690624.1 hypothetical protein [Campylobacter sp. RM9264]MCR8701467.1 hypothetical protein [Campylobacter sp. RM12176]